MAKFSSILLICLLSLFALAVCVPRTSSNLSPQEKIAFPVSLQDAGDSSAGVVMVKSIVSARPGDLIPIKFSIDRSVMPTNFYVGLYKTDTLDFIRPVGKISASDVGILDYPNKNEFTFYTVLEDASKKYAMFILALFYSTNANGDAPRLLYVGKEIVSYDPSS
ncbi:hypothetical protein AYI68_g3327 [Smittium mucronatum]|uniref:Uncharacterized protein n=1 Tax=Smittium mucronatum TaxID=133383 RepID=A0A1R0H084_9FUNG|nr:hypothetical protein AYI68_g3327 [Smittium mucronatum]